MARAEISEPTRKVVEHYRNPRNLTGFISRHFEDQSEMCALCDSHPETTITNSGRPAPDGIRAFREQEAEATSEEDELMKAADESKQQIVEANAAAAEEMASSTTQVRGAFIDPTRAPAETAPRETPREPLNSVQRTGDGSSTSGSEEEPGTGN